MRLRFSVLCLVASLSAGAALAQTPEPGLPPPPDPAPVTLPPPDKAPLPGTGASTPAQAPVRAPVPPVASSAPAPAAAALPTLVPSAGDPTGVEEVTLPAKPAAILTGTSNWADAFANLKDAVRKVEDALKGAGIAPAGKPLTVFVSTDDNGFHYKVMIPVAKAPEGRTELTPEIAFGTTPAGKAMRFVHKDSYEEIDGTYETITAYLDAKEIVAQDAFIEEYVSPMTDAKDANLEVNIYVQPKE